MLNALRTTEQRRAALRNADAELRIEALQRNPETAGIFEAWVNGAYTEAEAIDALKRHYAAHDELAKAS